MEFKTQLYEYAQWRHEVAQTIEMYREWSDRCGLSNRKSSETLSNMLQTLNGERVTLAFAGEFSRGKTELINALFFAEMGGRLLPVTTERTTMCPAELFYDAATPGYMRLLNIETRLEDTSLIEYRDNSSSWKQIDLDYDSPAQLQEAFKELFAVKKVSQEHAKNLGLWNEVEASELGLLDAEEVEIPCWRYALINLSHPLLKQGLCILDTPGLSALGIEPELTLNILPAAAAIIFVLAADRGITKRDFKVWHYYINNVRGLAKIEIAVVMNKMDMLMDEHLDTAEYDRSIADHVDNSAKMLGFNRQLIFPVSARQALVAKNKHDVALLEKSHLAGLESYLADNVVLPRYTALKQKITLNIDFLLSESLSLSEEKYQYALDQLEEFKKIDCDNAEMMDHLLIETRERQQAYLLNVKNFQDSYRFFAVQSEVLVDSLSKITVDAVIQRSKDELIHNLTTYHLKKKIQLLFDELRDLLQHAVEVNNETGNLTKEIHKKFGHEYGFKDVELKLFSLSEYQFQLECILEEGEIFRSSAKTTMTEQTVVVKKLYSLIISKVRKVFNRAHQDAKYWRKMVFLPLMHQIQDHKKQIDSRLHMLHKISGSKEDVAENIAFLEERLMSLGKQRSELQTIIGAIKLDEYAALIPRID
ncbi:dynamin family protein [Methyloprofundus sedimenti]|uniref:Dynamin family protein n=1 Tax=Methyloprofundus sedimenti TaxID=1420851 RepID=A0A1V8M5K1_9GAMM|nr:dynamin family protein [Methyloprofundus sedimenti]OQK16837.1 dynamin family protein [Methyloprofundus sedimenti]